MGPGASLEGSAGDRRTQGTWAGEGLAVPGGCSVLSPPRHAPERPPEVTGFQEARVAEGKCWGPRRPCAGGNHLVHVCFSGCGGRWGAETTLRSPSHGQVTQEHAALSSSARSRRKAELGPAL